MIRYLKEVIEDYRVLKGFERKVKARKYTSIRTGIQPTEEDGMAIVRSPRVYDFLRDSI